MVGVLQLLVFSAKAKSIFIRTILFPLMQGSFYQVTVIMRILKVVEIPFAKELPKKPETSPFHSVSIRFGDFRETLDKVVPQSGNNTNKERFVLKTGLKLRKCGSYWCFCLHRDIQGANKKLISRRQSYFIYFMTGFRSSREYEKLGIMKIKLSSI